eukprot:SAG11_NODE_3_length_39220_cov_67.005828_20_plen_144_part_00
MLNLGLALGDRVRERALGSESPSSECLSNGSAAELLFASNAVWALCVGTGGALVNVGFALVLIFKHRSCRHFCGKRKSTGLLEHDRYASADDCFQSEHDAVQEGRSVLAHFAKVPTHSGCSFVLATDCSTALLYCGAGCCTRR